MRRLIAVIALLALILLAGCKTKQVYVPVNSVRVDSVYQTHFVDRWHYERDSIYIDRVGDTIREVRYKTRYLTVNRTDTSYIERRDTVRVPYPVEVVVEKKQSLWQAAKEEAARLLGWLIAIPIIAVALWLWRRYRKM